MSELTNIGRLKVTVPWALVGSVTNNLCAVTAGIRGNQVLIWAYFEKPPSPEEIELIQIVGGEVIAHFSASCDYMIEERCLSMTEYEIEMLDFWAFAKTGLRLNCVSTDWLPKRIAPVP